MEEPTPVIVAEPVKVKKPFLKQSANNSLKPVIIKKQKKVIEPESDSSDDEPEPAKKKSKVITKGNAGSDMEQWGTTAIRTAALVSLAGATFYMQNIYGKKNIQTPAPAPTTQASIPMQANMLPTVNRSYVGKSGFAI